MFKNLAVLLSATMASGVLAVAQEVRQEVTVSATGIFNVNSWTHTAQSEAGLTFRF